MTSSIQSAFMAFTLALVPACGGRTGLPEPDPVEEPRPDPVPNLSISAGDWHTCAIDAQNLVRCWGRNPAGQLGNGTFTDNNKAALVKGLPNEEILQVSAGFATGTALTKGGAVYVWGELGKVLGLNDGSTAAVIPGWENGVRMIAAGDQHLCVVTDSEEAQCLGSNIVGELGRGFVAPLSGDSFEETPAPVLLPEKAKVKGLSAGGSWSTCTIVEEDGGARNSYCWGSNYDGQIGAPDITPDDHTFVEPTPRLVESAENFSQIATGGDPGVVTSSGRACGIQKDTLICWGDIAGDVDDPLKRVSFPKLTPVSHRGIGWFHQCAVQKDPSGDIAWCWGGLNEHGELGIPLSPVGSEVAHPDPIPLFSLPPYIAGIAAGSEHTCAQMESGEIYCWGAADKVGDGLTHKIGESQPDPVEVVRE